MRKPYFAAPVIIGAVAVMAGCGQTVAGAHNAADPSRTSSSPAASSSTGTTSTGAGAAAPSSPPAAGGPLRCAAPPVGSVPGKSLMLSNATMGKTYCAGVGTDVLIFLHGTPSARWAPIRVSSNVLQPRANGRLMLALGVTGASYVAVRPGTAIITSYRPACSGSVPAGSGGSSGSVPTGPVGLPAGSPGVAAVASPPTMMCGALIGFRVTVLVR